MREKVQERKRLQTREKDTDPATGKRSNRRLKDSKETKNIYAMLDNAGVVAISKQTCFAACIDCLNDHKDY